MRSLRPLLLTSLLAFPLAASAAAEEASSVSVEGATVTTDQVMAVASTRGSNALDLIRSARTTLESGDYAQATTSVAQAADELKRLRQINPSAVLQDGIRSVQATLASGDVDGAYARLQPISESLTVVGDYASATEDLEVETDKPRIVGGSAAKQHIANAMGHLEQKDVTRATAELDAAYETAVYTEVDLPVTASLISVDEALAALRGGAKNGYDKGYAAVAQDHLEAAQSRAEIIVETARRAGVDVDVAAEPE
jgi:hypothetical protein